MQIDAERSPQIRAVIQTIAGLPTEMRKQIRQHAKRIVQPEWQKALREEAPPDRIFHDRLVTPSAAYVSDRNIRLRSGKAGKFPRETEFGAYRDELNTYSNRRGTRIYRHTQRQFWHFVKVGRVAFPAARDIIPRIGALWVQTTVRTIHEIIEKVL